jgi:hypothetical protein
MDLNNTKMDQRGKTPDRQKKNKNKKSRLEHGCLSLVSVVCCQVEVSATSWSLVQRSPTECGVPKCVIAKPRKMRRHRPPRGCRAIGKKIGLFLARSSYYLLCK